MMALTGYIFSTLFELLYSSPNRKKISYALFWKAALSNAIASPIGYESLKYLSYPMMVLTKSSKHVPLMFVGTILYKQIYIIKLLNSKISITLEIVFRGIQKPSCSLLKSLLGTAAQAKFYGLTF